MSRWIANLFCIACLALAVLVAALWVRSLTRREAISWQYDRYLPDRSAASTAASICSTRHRIWVDWSWGRVGPYNGQLVWGYYVNADRSGGAPDWDMSSQPLLDSNSMADLFDPGINDNSGGVGPVRWSFARRTAAVDGDDATFIRLGIAHWLAALLLLAPPLWRFRRMRIARRAFLRGHCRRCGYDLRASPDRCPECGLARQPA